MRSKSCAASRAVRQNLVTFVNQSSLEEFLDNPPACLDVIVVQSNVRIIHIYHVSHSLGHFFPHSLVGENRLSALLVEFSNAVLLYVLLAFNSQLLLNFDFNREPVSIPSGLSVYLEALHCLVTVN